MNLRKGCLAGLVLFAALGFGAAGCSSPRAQIVLRRAHLGADKVYYVAAEQFKAVKFTPPPAPGSEAQKADLAVTLDWQQKRTGADCAKANLTAGAGYDSFWGVNSPFPQPLPKEVKTFFARISYDLDGAVTVMKDRYQRPRPYAAYPGQAVPCVSKSWGYSYPSGHTTFSRVFADVLSDIVPERRAEFYAKADEIAGDRVIGGVHFASDIAAGKAFGDMFHEELLKSPEYMKEVERLKTLRAN
jgi:acid phosphatase (class A)